jgi:N-acetylmuramoyl-L-alanine amidase
VLGFSFRARAVQPDFEADYQDARVSFYRFMKDQKRKKFRHHWQNLAAKFESIAKTYPDSARAEDALYTAGKLYTDLYRRSWVDADLQHAVDLFRRLVKNHPESHLADDAQMNIAIQWIEFKKETEAAIRELQYLVERFPKGDVTPRAKRMLEDLGSTYQPKALKTPKDSKAVVVQRKTPHQNTKPSVHESQNKKEPDPSNSIKGPILSQILTDSGPDYTRITLHTRSTAVYKYGILPASGSYKHPRLYVDILNAQLDEGFKGPINVRDSVVRRIRFGPFSKDVIRVVIDLRSLGEHKVFPMGNPARVVIDISAGQDQVANIIGQKASARKPKAVTPQRPKEARTMRPRRPRIPSKSKSRPGRSLSMLAGLKIRRVVIDPGHGGGDPGAIGPKGTLEKDIALDIAKRLVALLRKDKSLGLKEIIMTRSDDRFIALEKRTAIANAKKADLFISIHCNAHKIRRFRGVETFYLDLTNDRYSTKLAARENATSEKTISDLQFILADLALKSHVDDSIGLGRSIQKGMIGTLRKHYKSIKDLKLKPALFYVLIGARMPSVLVEASFLSNVEEEKRLRTKAYRQRVAVGVHIGVKNYIESRNREMAP